MTGAAAVVVLGDHVGEAAAAACAEAGSDSPTGNRVPVYAQGLSFPRLTTRGLVGADQCPMPRHVAPHRDGPTSTGPLHHLWSAPLVSPALLTREHQLYRFPYRPVEEVLCCSMLSYTYSTSTPYLPVPNSSPRSRTLSTYCTHHTGDPTQITRTAISWGYVVRCAELGVLAPTTNTVCYHRPPTPCPTHTPPLSEHKPPTQPDTC